MPMGKTPLEPASGTAPPKELFHLSLTVREIIRKINHSKTFFNL